MFTAQDVRDLKSCSDEVLHSRTVGLAQREREVTERLLWHLKEIDVRRLYLDFNVGSLHAYCTKELKMSEGSAHRRVTAARLLRDFPELSEKLVDGSLNLSTLTTLHSFVKAEEVRTEKKMAVEDKRELLAKIENCSKHQTEQRLAEALPEARPAQETSRTLANGDLLKTIRISPELEAKLERIREMHSHDSQFSTLVGILSALAEDHIERYDPEVKEPPTELRPTAGRHRVNQTVSVTTYLHKRAGSQCEDVDAHGRRCPRRHHLQIDHIIPLARGGTNDPSNLQLLCRPHNLRKGVGEPTKPYLVR